MSSFSDYIESAVLNHVFRNTPLTSPASVRVGLFTAAPSDTGGGTEVSGSGYARQSVTFGAPSQSGESARIANTGAVSFTASGGAFGTVTHVGYFDAATGGNLLAWAPITNATIGDGDTLNFASGALTVSLS